MISKTNWHIITGGPSSGKSKLIDALAFEGFRIVPEAARILIDEEMSRGKTLQDIRSNEEAFQIDVLKMKIRAEDVADPQSLIFWERGIPDSIAYLQCIGADSQIALDASLLRRYQKVFLLEPLPLFEQDYARIENQVEANEIHWSLRSCYRELGYSIVEVPVHPISERVEIIRRHVR